MARAWTVVLLVGMGCARPVSAPVAPVNGNRDSAPAAADLDLRFDLPRTDRGLFVFLAPRLSVPRFTSPPEPPPPGP